MKTAKLEILENSLIKKEARFAERLQNHFDTVKQANGQPLNDKRNGPATLRKWDKQNDALNTIKEGIEKTKNAIEIEKGKIFEVESTKKNLPEAILKRIEDGSLVQWRKHPTTFFVHGVDKARIVWDVKKKIVAHKYLRTIESKEQWKKFAQMFNQLKKETA